MNENTQTTTQTSATTQRTSRKQYVRLAIIIAAVVIIGALAYSGRGLFIAATVNGNPISRMSVLGELEKQSGSQMLDSLITKKLIEAELKKQGIVVTDADITKGIQDIEAQIKAQGGGTLKDALAAQHMSENDLKNQIKLQKGLEKLLADKTVVTDADIETYIKDNKITPPKGQEEATKSQIKTELQQQKFSEEAQKWVEGIKGKATVHYFGNYSTPTAPTQG